LPSFTSQAGAQVHKRWRDLMLYNTNWETPQNVLSRESLIAWLEKQPPEQLYDYMACEGACLYGQYMAHHGISWQESGASPVFTEKNPSLLKGRAEFCSEVYLHVAMKLPWTCGAALERARAATF
jgi:hypothetical protein